MGKGVGKFKTFLFLVLAGKIFLNFFIRIEKITSLKNIRKALKKIKSKFPIKVTLVFDQYYLNFNKNLLVNPVINKKYKLPRS